MDNEKFGSFIKELRKKSNLTQKELGEKLNVTDKAVSKWERGLSFPDITIINDLAKVFNITATEILNSKLDNNDKPKEENEEEIKKRVNEAINKYKKIEEKRMKGRRKAKLITTIISLILLIISVGLQLFYYVFAKSHNYEYIIDIIPYILNEVIIITLSILSIFFTKKGKIKNIIISSIIAITTIINIICLANIGLANRSIISFSKGLKRELILKVEKESGTIKYYRKIKLFVFAKQEYTLANEATGEIKCEWLGKNVCTVTYKDKNKDIQSFVATYGGIDGVYGYINIITCFNGTWQSKEQYNKIFFEKDRVRIINNGDTEIFKYENVKQYGVLSIVLYNDEKIPRYVITFNDNCKVDPQTYTLKENGTILMTEVKMRKTKVEEYVCITYKNDDHLDNYNKPYVEKNSYQIKGGALYVRYDDDKIIEVPGTFYGVKWSKNNYQVSPEKTIFYYDENEKRYLIYSDDKGETWQKQELPKKLKDVSIECIQFLNSKVGYMLEFDEKAMGTTSGKIYKTTDGGKNWIVINEGMGNNSDKHFNVGSKIKFINENIGFVTMPISSGDSSELYISNDGGKTFSKLDLIKNQNDSKIYDYYNLPIIDGDNVYVNIDQGADGDYNGGDTKTFYSNKDCENWNLK